MITCPCCVAPLNIAYFVEAPIADLIEQFMERAGYDDFLIAQRDAWSTAGVGTVSVCVGCVSDFRAALAALQDVLGSNLGAGEFAAQGTACLARLGRPTP